MSVVAATVVVLEPGYADYAVERAAIAPFGARLAVVRPDDDAAAACSALDPVALMVRERAVPAALMALCPNLRLVVRYGVGVDNIDVEAARAARIAVANVPDYGTEHEVADHAVALYLAVARRIVQRDSAVRAGAWELGQAALVPGHRGATLGLVGFGRIGRATWRRFRALGFGRALVHDPALDAATALQAGVTVTDLDRLCAEADAISLHVPLTPETRHMIDARRIALMRRTAVVVNVARGGIVDEAALAAALNDGRLFGAGIDVFETEPPPPGHPLRHTPNTVLTDHAGWYSEQSVRALQDGAAAEVVRVLGGGMPANWLNRWS